MCFHVKPDKIMGDPRDHVKRFDSGVLWVGEPRTGFVLLRARAAQVGVSLLAGAPWQGRA